MLYVPSFKHNLLIVRKISHSGDCKVIFNIDFCNIESTSSQALMGIGRVHNGLYYLVDECVKQILQDLKCKDVEKGSEK